MTLKEDLKQKALELGYVRAGVTSAEGFEVYAVEVKKRPDYEFLCKDKRHIVQNTNLKERYPEAKSVMSVVYSYTGIDYPEKLLKYIGRAYLARCYTPPASNIHGARLVLLKDYIRSKGIRVFDDAFLPDRLAGALAGTITFGKNNFAYAGEYGSFIILSTIVMDCELEADESTVMRRCPEKCNLCMEACPTLAISEPGRLLPYRCVGFNNWFRQDEKNVSPYIPYEVREKLGSRFHGCDICQEVCPQNHKALSMKGRKDPLLEKIAEKFDLEKLLFLDDDYYHEVVEPIMFNYIKDYRYFKRNAAIVMGNSGEKRFIPALRKAAGENNDGMLADAISWAIKRLECDAAI